MGKLSLRKSIISVLILFIVAFMIYNVYILGEYKQIISHSEAQKYDHVTDIATVSKNLANRLEQFIELANEASEEQNIDSVHGELFDHWRVVTGEVKHIGSFVTSISASHRKNDIRDWSLFTYSLNRIDQLIHGMTDQFLEHRSFALQNGQIEKLNAVISVYNTIQAHEPTQLASILQAIEAPMKVIDHHYAGVLMN